MRQRLLFSALALSVAAAIPNLQKSLDLNLPGNALLHPEEIESVNFYMQGLQVLRFDSKGTLLHAMNAESASQLAGDSNISLAGPDLHLLLSARPAWSVTADSGMANDKNDVISLTGNVLLKREDGLLSLSGKNLSLDTQLDIAYADTPVIITSSNSVTKANGLKLDFKREIYQLRHHVSTRYVP